MTRLNEQTTDSNGQNMTHEVAIDQYFSATAKFVAATNEMSQAFEAMKHQPKRPQVAQSNKLARPTNQELQKIWADGRYTDALDYAHAVIEKMEQLNR